MFLAEVYPQAVHLINRPFGNSVESVIKYSGDLDQPRYLETADGKMVKDVVSMDDSELKIAKAAVKDIEKMGFKPDQE